MLFYPRHSFDCEVRQKVNTINIIFKVRVERERERETIVDTLHFRTLFYCKDKTTYVKHITALIKFVYSYAEAIMTLQIIRSNSVNLNKASFITAYHLLTC